MVSYQFKRKSDGQIMALAEVEKDFIDGARHLFPYPDAVCDAIGEYRIGFEVLCLAGIYITNNGPFSEEAFAKTAESLSPELADRYREFLSTRYIFTSWR